MCLQTVYFYPFNGKALVYEIVCPVTYGFTSINSSDWAPCWKFN